ncbi:hypothetical protein PZA11_000138 [Diplocarpon coronariae]
MIFSKEEAKGYRGDDIVFTALQLSGLFTLSRSHTAIATEADEKAMNLSPIQPPELINMETTPQNSNKTDSELLHRRLGHLNYTELKKLVDDNYGLSMEARIALKGERNCESCLAGRMKEQFNKKTDTRIDKICRRLYADISGTLPPLIRGYRYFLLVVDDACRCCWIRLLKNKSADEIQPKIKDLKKQLETENSTSVVYWRSDNGIGEFGGRFLLWLLEGGMTPEPSPAYKHSLNGVVERWMYEITKIARSCIYDAKMNSYMWCYAVEWACRLKNRRPTKALPFGELKGLTPLEAYSERTEDLSKIRVFGSRAFLLNNRGNGPGKFESRTIMGAWILVGMTSSKMYKLLNVETLKELISADVKFDEYSTYNVREVQLQERPQNKRLAHGAMSSIRPIRPVDITERPLVRATERPVHETERVHGTERPATLESLENRQAEVRGTIPQRVIENIPEASDQRVLKQIETPTSRYGRKLKPKRVFGEVNTQESALTSIGNQPTVPIEVISVYDALSQNPKEWREAILSEFEAVKSAGTFKIILGKPPIKRKLIKSRLVLRNKIVNGVLVRRKARIVLKGYEQQYEVDYFDTFASVIRHTTLRVLLAFAASRDLEIEQIDIDTAFLNAYLAEDVYMALPDDECDLFYELYPQLRGKQAYIKLLRSLYGLKQAPREWWLLVKDEMEKAGLRSAKADPNLFIWENQADNTTAYILVFMDDMLIIGKQQDCDYLKKKILNTWKGKDLGPISTFIGIQVERDRKARTLRIHQTDYIKKILNRFGMANCKGNNLPALAGTVLRKLGTDEAYTNELLQPDDISLYQQIIGSVIYPSNLTRPDISYIVGQLARHMATPLQDHLQATKPLLRYLQKTAEDGITYGKGEPNQFDAYTDATWATENDRKSFQGWLIKYNGGVVSWAANRQKSTSLSSEQAEIMAASDGSREVAWMLKLFADLNIQLDRLPYLWLDNEGARSLTKERKFSAKSKHIDVRHFYIRDDMVAKGKMTVAHIPGNDNMADSLTKALPGPAFEKYKGYMGLPERKSTKEGYIKGGNP